MENYFFPGVTPEEIQKERSKSRELRRTSWWKKKREKGICFYCEERFKPSELTMDHLVPLVRGGKSKKGNLVPSCKECNNKKKNRLAFEWEGYTDR